MKNLIKVIKDFLIDIFLLIISIMSLVILAPWGFVEIIISTFWKKRFVKGLKIFGDFIKTLAIVVDVAGNVLMQIPMNRILIKNDGYQFGSRFDTISYVLGRGLVEGTLSKAGLKMCKILDYFESDHCVMAYFNRHK